MLLNFLPALQVRLAISLIAEIDLLVMFNDASEAGLFRVRNGIHFERGKDKG